MIPIQRSNELPHSENEYGHYTRTGDNPSGENAGSYVRSMSQIEQHLDTLFASEQPVDLAHTLKNCHLIFKANNYVGTGWQREKLRYGEFRSPEQRVTFGPVDLNATQTGRELEKFYLTPEGKVNLALDPKTTRRHVPVGNIEAYTDIGQHTVPGSWAWEVACVPVPPEQIEGQLGIVSDNLNQLLRALRLAQPNGNLVQSELLMNSLADIYQDLCLIHPFPAANNSLHFAVVNSMLKRMGYSPVPHGQLDTIAPAATREEFEELFRAHVLQYQPAIES